MNGHGADRVTVEFEHEEIFDLGLNLIARARHESRFVHTLLHHGKQCGHVGGPRFADLLVFVAMNHGANTFVREEFG